VPAACRDLLNTQDFRTGAMAMGTGDEWIAAQRAALHQVFQPADEELFFCRYDDFFLVALSGEHVLDDFYEKEKPCVLMYSFSFTCNIVMEGQSDYVGVHRFSDFVSPHL
jgi:hypothetical protein